MRQEGKPNLDVVNLYFKIQLYLIFINCFLSGDYYLRKINIGTVYKVIKGKNGNQIRLTIFIFVNFMVALLIAMIVS